MKNKHKIIICLVFGISIFILLKLFIPEYNLTSETIPPIKLDPIIIP